MLRSRSRSKGRNSQPDPAAALRAELTISEACDMGMQFFMKAKGVLDDENSQLASGRIELAKEQGAHEARVQEWRRAGELFAEGVSSRVKLNVGGQLFETSRTTLMSEEGTYFYSLLHSGMFKPDSDGTYFIDRDPRTFRYILNYLRDGVVVDTSKLESLDRQILLKDIDYFQIESLRHVVLASGPDYSVQEDPYSVQESSEDSRDKDTLARMLAQGIKRVLKDAKKAGRAPIAVSDMPAEFLKLWKVPLNFGSAGEFDLTSFLLKWPKLFSVTCASSRVIVELANG